MELIPRESPGSNDAGPDRSLTHKHRMTGKADEKMNDMYDPDHRNNKRQNRFRQLAIALCALVLLPAVLTGCSREDRKPELTPKILTSAPHATNLRKYTVPEGMTGYIDLVAMEEALETGDIQLEGVDRVYVLKEEPDELTPSFNAQNGEVMVVYRNIAENDRSFIIYQYPSMEPGVLLEEQAAFYSTEEISGESFHILDLPQDNPDQEAYAIRDGWLIHLRAIGFSAEEFREALTSLTSHRLD